MGCGSGGSGNGGGGGDSSSNDCGTVTCSMSFFEIIEFSRSD